MECQVGESGSGVNGENRIRCQTSSDIDPHVPLTGACHFHQTLLAATSLRCWGSPGSRVAPMMDPPAAVAVGLYPFMTKAFEKLSLPAMGSGVAEREKGKSSPNQVVST